MVYKTVNNLKKVWGYLDDACGSLDNALIFIGSMKSLPEDAVKSIDNIDFSAVVNLKNSVEELIEELENNPKKEKQGRETGKCKLCKNEIGEANLEVCSKCASGYKF